MAEEAQTRIAARNGSVSKTVLEYFLKHPGVLLHVSTVRSDTGLSDSQIRGAIRKMAEDGTTGEWVVNLRGSAWTFNPPKVKREGIWLMVEVVGALDGDRKLIRAEDGSYATLTPVNL